MANTCEEITGVLVQVQLSHCDRLKAYLKQRYTEWNIALQHYSDAALTATASTHNSNNNKNKDKGANEQPTNKPENTVNNYNNSNPKMARKTLQTNHEFILLTLAENSML